MSDDRPWLVDNGPADLLAMIDTPPADLLAALDGPTATTLLAGPPLTSDQQEHPTLTSESVSESCDDPMGHRGRCLVPTGIDQASRVTG